MNANRPCFAMPDRGTYTRRRLPPVLAPVVLVVVVLPVVVLQEVVVVEVVVVVVVVLLLLLLAVAADGAVVRCDSQPGRWDRTCWYRFLEPLLYVADGHGRVGHA